jgi:hypothetical protein
MPVFFLPVRVICLVKNAAEPRVHAGSVRARTLSLSGG